jgi:predicted RNase H-like nuclease (RuvC/YqgF family)
MHSVQATIAETALVGAGWVGICKSAIVAQAELPALSDQAQVTLAIAIGGIGLQLMKMYLEFRQRAQSVELERAKRDIREYHESLTSREDDVQALRDEISQLRQLLYGYPKHNDAARSPDPVDGKSKPVD